jgi:hypothetical protein
VKKGYSIGHERERRRVEILGMKFYASVKVFVYLLHQLLVIQTRTPSGMKGNKKREKN